MNESFIDTIEYIKSDLFRYTANGSAKAFLKELLLNRSFRYTFWLRLTNTRNAIIRITARVIHNRLSMKYGLHIPRQTKIGYGLYIGHPLGIVINPTTTIGNNCNLSQFTTIGSNHENAATIGDGVYIGPNVCIVENVVIGDFVTIGAGAVVTRDIPENSTAAGCPASVISRNNPARYIKNRWPADAGSSVERMS